MREYELTVLIHPDLEMNLRFITITSWNFQQPLQQKFLRY